MASSASGTQQAADPQRSTGTIKNSGDATNLGKTANTAGSSSITANENPKPSKKKKRGGRKRTKRRKSFTLTSQDIGDAARSDDPRPNLANTARTATQQASFYRLHSGNRSNTSLESEALLDHRDHGLMRSRRLSTPQGYSRNMQYTRQRPSDVSGHRPGRTPRASMHHPHEAAVSEEEYEQDDDANDRTPLLSSGNAYSKAEASRTNSGFGYGSHSNQRSARRASGASRSSSRWRVDLSSSHGAMDEPHDVNNPPSVPASPELGPLNDVYIPNSVTSDDHPRDAIINIDGDGLDRGFSNTGSDRRKSMVDLAERDVCFPGDDDDGMSEVIDDDLHHVHHHHHHHHHPTPSRRRRARVWPDLEILEDWSREEKEERSHQEVLRVKRISEPVMVGGRLRPAKTVWHREEDDAPFRFTYFNECFDGTIHARTISDLLQEGAEFRDLFIPDPPELSDDSDDEEDPRDDHVTPEVTVTSGPPSRDPIERRLRQVSTQSEIDTVRSPSVFSKSNVDISNPPSGRETPKPERQKRYGPRPTFWLDVLQPTEMEMKVLAKAFGIHQLTIEDILMEEPREKVELFQSYYFVNYRTFEQDKDSEDYMEPINMYVVVFRDGVISFHHSMCPHPANVRRRIRQLNDYMSPTADWISYAIIDDVTDVYGPLVSQIEQEVDEIDEDILYMHTTSADNALPIEEKESGQRPKSSKGRGNREKDDFSNLMPAKPEGGERSSGSESGGDMLRRVGECRKKVMGLYRLLGNKADVIKSFAKRCNEHWDVAPRSEIGLYLGDIQDHIVTMTGNLSHYESLLSRAHGNYVAQINIRMNERAESNADVLGKLTVLGTIVLPMNIITGMWGMNVWVPGQEFEGDLTWFFCITAGLVAFGLTSYFIAKKVYGIV